mmetsp:Transcript_16442/g.37909  ORF Transcript_16442/g.37909 Transcript_16442/m.37909 type:complete len:164 (-) Transcript_16442:40-531(-)
MADPATVQAVSKQCSRRRHRISLLAWPAAFVTAQRLVTCFAGVGKHVGFSSGLTSAARPPMRIGRQAAEIADAVISSPIPVAPPGSVAGTLILNFLAPLVIALVSVGVLFFVAPETILKKEDLEKYRDAETDFEMKKRGYQEQSQGNTRRARRLKRARKQDAK